ncbi:hypothetical protein OG943_44340 [Amycolatopsis sp. NBC_00345]|uniref:hypothetical protein n=1 Tax=Amycolatopsis sp. NBC_00345 TaxID=2975955 RepID=UPI002E273BE4
MTAVGLGVIPAALGIVLELVALFAVPWVTFTSGTASVSMTFLDLLRQSDAVRFSSGLATSYVQWFAFLVTVVTMASVLPWTLGALRTKRSAFLLSSIRRKELTHANFWWYRTVFAGRATVMLLLHAAGVVLIFARNFSLLGLGPYLLVGGALLVVVGAAIGPRKAPGMPR